MPVKLVVMGVSGSGKSTLAEAFSERWALRFIEGDQLHSFANVDKMTEGIPLTDEDRWPWLDRIGTAMLSVDGVVASCSALRRVYRDRIRAVVGPRLRFCHLDLPRDVLFTRMLGREGHYMPASLLDDQLKTLEKPHHDETDVIVLDGTKSLHILIAEITARLRRIDQPGTR